MKISLGSLVFNYILNDCWKLSVEKIEKFIRIYAPSRQTRKNYLSRNDATACFFYVIHRQVDR